MNFFTKEKVSQIEKRNCGPQKRKVWVREKRAVSV